MATWKIDPDHSAATFTIKHMMVTNVRGLFSKVTGTIQFEPADPGGCAVEATIDVSSLSTGNRTRDDHLFSADFFELSKYPEIVFKSTKVQKGEGNRIKVTGDLTLHGVTRPVTMDVEYSGPVKSPPDMGGETTIGFAATTVITREDFAIQWNVPIEDGGVVAGHEVRIALDIEADLAG
jgi:polyisoprenoid-binding protein YceI